ncbi:MAG: protein kinase [Myxococcota bacterium]
MAGEELRQGMILGDRFRLSSRIGNGGFGEVWRALDLASTQEVAVKILFQERAKNAASLQRFGREAEIIASLRHPSIARAVAFSVDATPAYLAMELVEGIALGHELTQRSMFHTPFSGRERAVLIQELAAGLDHAHQAGVIHRDLKPMNLVVSVTAEVLHLKILDFGIAKYLNDSGSRATTMGRVIGSPLYMSPEQIRAEGIDARADVFGMGCVCFELLTLRRLYAIDERGSPLACSTRPASQPSNTPLHVMQRILGGVRGRVRELFPEAPAELDAVIERATAVRPTDRYPSAGAFAKDLLAVLARASAVFGPEEGVAPTLIFSAIPPADTDQRPVITADDASSAPPALMQGLLDLEDAALPPVTPLPLESGDSMISHPLSVSASSQALRARPAVTTPLPYVDAPRRGVLVRSLLLVALGAFGMKAVGMLLDRLIPPEPQRVAVAPPEPALSSAPVRTSTEAPRAAVTAVRVEAVPAPTPLASPSATPAPAVSRRLRPEVKAPDPKPRERAPESPLARALAAAREQPSDAKRVVALREAILAANEKLPDGPKKKGIQRRALATAFAPDFRALEACAEELLAP